MTEHNTPKLRIPPPAVSFRLSRAALVLLLATVILALLIGVSTYRNINRSRNLIEDFLVKKGATIVRALEAGNRASMMHHHMGSGDPLHTLLLESIKEDDIAFILIMNKQGRIVDQTAKSPDFSLTDHEIDTIVRADTPITSVDESNGIFIISQLFQPRKHFAQNRPRSGRMMMQNYMVEPETRIITIGLSTKEFDAARKRDMRHGLFMGAILFLVGNAGLYVLFLYQENRIARATLADLKIYTDNVIESMPAGLVTLDAQDRVVSCNRKAEQILGDTIDGIRGTAIIEAFPHCFDDRAALHSYGLEHAYDCKTADGETIPIQISGSSLVNENNEQTGTVLIIQDMTAKRQMEQQLERSRHMAALGKMAAGIAHEIRNPLGTLRGFAHYFGNLPGGNDESKDYAELMKSEVDRLNRHVSGLLQFARPKEPNITEVFLDELITKTTAMTQGDFSKKGLSFHQQCNTGIKIEADADQLLQVLMNILQNSVAATPSGGEVSLGAEYDGNSVRITVCDTGSGMTEQEREKMFDPFFTTRKNGTGLGLAVSHQIIQQHNGYFEVETAPGKGSTITIVLPQKRGRI